MTNVPAEIEKPAANKSASIKSNVTIVLIVGLVALVFLTPYFYTREIMNYYAGAYDKALVGFIPQTTVRYSFWISFASIVLITFHQNVFSNEVKNRKRLCLAVLIFAILMNCLICTRALQFPYCLDDTYIVFRYVGNLLQFGCADFEVGKPVHAISSQLHFWMLVGCAFLGGMQNLAVLAQSINIAFEIGSLFVLFTLLRSLFSNTWLALYGCAIHVMWVYNFLGACHGKESSATVFLLFGMLYATVSQREKLRAWTAALLSLARPEGIAVLAASVIGDARVKIETAVWKKWLLPISLVGLVYLGMYLYYGTVLPQGLLLKSSIYNIEPLTCVSMIVYLLTSAFFNLKLQVTGATALLALVGIYALTIVLLSKYKPLRVYLVSLCLITAAFCFGNALIMYFPWYCAWWVPIPPLFFTALIRRIGEIKFLTGKSKVLKVLTMLVQGLIITGSLVALPFAYTRVQVGDRIWPIQIFYWDKVSERLRVYEKAGAYLNQMAPDASLVGIGELGIIGTVYKGKMFDLQGMVTPEALKLYPVPPDKRSPTCVFSLPPQFPRMYKPDRMLFLDSFGRKGLLEDPYFKENYELEHFWENGTFDSIGVYLYKRKGKP